MRWLLDRLAEPWQSGIVLRAALELVVVGAVSGALGTFVVLRGLAFTGEAFAHTIFPGAVLAAALGGSIVGGALVFGLVSAAAVWLVARQGPTGEDAAVGVVFIGLFGVGAILFAVLDTHGLTLESFLFGSLLGVSWADLALTCGAGALVLATLWSIRRALVLRTFDLRSASAAGTRTSLVDAALLVVLALAVVVGVQAIGNVLVLAMLVTPAATARLVGRRLWQTLAFAIALGVVEGTAGLYVSYYADVAAGGAVVLVASGVFLAVLVASSGGRAWLTRLRPA